MMKYLVIAFSIALGFLLTSCSPPPKQELPLGHHSLATQIGTPPKEPLLKVNYVDQNGISETIVQPARIRQFAATPILSPQSYKKLLRIYKKDSQGNARSILTSYFDNGNLHRYLECVNARASGWYVEWHDNGQKKLQVYVLAGMADLNDQALLTWSFDGEALSWDTKGTLVARCTYEQGKLTGEYTTYTQDGKIASKSLWKNGLQQGLSLLYSPQGTIQESYMYVQGKRSGKAEGFYQETRLFEEQYEDDALMSGTYYHMNGKILSQVQNGHGVRSLYEEGKCTSQHEVHGGIPEGKVSLFTAKGRLEKTYFLKDGKKNGLETWYYTDTGQKKREFSWAQDEIHGLVQTWYPNGMMESKKEMAHNQKQGLTTCWYADGGIMLVEEYQSDKLIRGKYLRKGMSEPISVIEKGTGTATLFDSTGNFVESITYRDSLPEIKE